MAHSFDYAVGDEKNLNNRFDSHCEWVEISFIDFFNLIDLMPFG